MKLKKRDWAVVLAALAVMAGAGYALWDNFGAVASRKGAQEVGVVRVKRNVAQQKYSDGAIWQELNKAQPVYNFDSVRTVADSEAEIVLKSGDVITLGENTLITLEFGEDGQGIALSAGSLSAKSGGPASAQGPSPAGGKGGASGLVIKSDKARVLLSGGQASVSLNGKEAKDLKVAVSEGVASVRAEGQAQAVPVAKGETARLAPEASKPVVAEDPLFIESPADGAYALTVGDRASVAVSWKARSGQADCVAEAAKDSGFTKIAAQAKGNAQGNSASLSLAPGAYYVRVRSGKDLSESRRVTVISDSRPRPLSPADAARFSYRKSTPKISFSWGGGAKANNFLLEVSASSDFGQVIASARSATAACSLDSLPEGEYWWRVRPYYGFGGLEWGQPSEARSLTVERREGIAAPQPLSPREGEVFPDMASTGKGLSFAWVKDDEASLTTLTVSRAPDMGDPVAGLDSGASSAGIKDALEPDTYYWQLTSRSADGSVAKGPVRSFAISRLEVVIKQIEPREGRVFDFSLGQGLDFSWSAANASGGNFVLELSTDKGFASVGSKVETKDRKASLGGLEPGEYWWRVRYLDSSGVERSATEGRRLSVQRPLEAPRDLRPSGGEGKPLVSLPSIPFDWKPVEGATSYTLVLLDLGGKEAFRAAGIEKPAYDFSRFDLIASPGRYAWRVRAERKTTEGTRLGSFAEARFAVGKLVNCPPAPALLLPVAISPVKGAKVDMETKDALVIKWKPVQGASRYSLSLFQKGKGDKAIFTVGDLKATEYRFANLEKLDVGQFYFVLRAETVEEGYLTRQSPELRVDFTITLSGAVEAPKILSPEVQFDR
jgi:hypothetical protein